MTIVEKFASLTPEQREKFNAVKDTAALDAFVSEIKLELTDEERRGAIEFIEKGVLPLSDEELENVAGGVCDYILTALPLIN